MASLWTRMRWLETLALDLRVGEDQTKDLIDALTERVHYLETGLTLAIAVEKQIDPREELY